jgi:hypothetical protein
VTTERIYAIQSITSPTNVQNALKFESRLAVTSATRTTVTVGSTGQILVLAGNTQDITGLVHGYLGTGFFQGSGTVQEANAFTAQFNMTSAGQTVTEWNNFKSEDGFHSAGTMTAAYGFHHEGFAAGTTKRAIYVEADPSLFTAVGMAIVAKTGAYTLTDDDYTVTCDSSGGAFTITLPAASGRTGRVYNIKKTDSSANAVTVDGNASETIDGATTVVITTQYDSLQIQSDGSNWHII